MIKFNLDSAIFTAFLIITIVVGLRSSKGITTIKEYALGDRNFSTATIVATLVATWVGGDWFFNSLHETYTNGLYFVWASVLGNVLCFLSIGIIFAPRLAEFLGKLSIAEAMGELYGKKVRIVTAISGFIGASGLIAVQLKVSGLLFEYCFDAPSHYGILIGGAVVTLYSTLGGIKSVTFTDVIQFFTFGTIIPTIVFFVVGSLDNIEIFTTTLLTHELFDYKQVFDFTQPDSIYYLFIFLFTFLPAFNPAVFQRISMAKNTAQVSRSFIIAAFIAMLIGIMLAWIGALILSTIPDLTVGGVVKHIIFDYSYVGLRGLTLACIMAMVMSTADSYINSTAVLVVHDFCKPLKINILKDELAFCRLASLLIGVVAVIFALNSGSLLQLVLTTCSFYMPIVTVPFVMSLFGFRSSGKSVLIGMSAGFMGVVIWELFFKTHLIDGLIPGMAANLSFLLASYYLLKQPGGWVGIKDDHALRLIRHARRVKIKNLIDSIKNFNPIIFCYNNSPRNEAIYAFFGLFCIISIFSTMHTLPKEIQLQYSQTIEFIYPCILFMSTILMSYSLWPTQWKNLHIISVFWNISVFYILICVGFLLVIISNFAHYQLMAFMVNLIIIAVLLKWQWALFLMITGVMVTTQFFKFYIGVDATLNNISSIQFESAYILLLVSSTLIIFLKPKQEYQVITEEKVEYLSGKITLQDKQLREALALKGEFIRNISHEYHAPMTGVISMAQVLWESYEKLSDDQRKNAAETIFKSSIRLENFDANITSLSKLNKSKYKLKLEKIDLSDLLLNRLAICQKLYEENKGDRNFVLNTAEKIEINADKYYLSQALDSLIINAISYCKNGKITITLQQTEQEIEFTISDEGIGIPTGELDHIFGEFTVSSKTYTKAGGRGIGLALCRRVIEVHGGSISAESNGKNWTCFKFNLPISL